MIKREFGIEWDRNEMNFRMATLLLVVPGHEMMTVGIFNFYIGGPVYEAAPLGLILVILGAVCLFAISKIAGTKMGGVFG